MLGSSATLRLAAILAAVAASIGSSVLGGADPSAVAATAVDATRALRASRLALATLRLAAIMAICASDSGGDVFEPSLAPAWSCIRAR